MKNLSKLFVALFAITIVFRNGEAKTIPGSVSWDRRLDKICVLDDDGDIINTYYASDVVRVIS